MKRTIFLILFCLLTFSSTATAKISIDNYTVNDEQVFIIKGYLYNLASNNTVAPKNLKTYLPHVTGAISWLNENHTSNQVFNLRTINDNNSIIILNAIQNINNFVTGALPKTIIEAALVSWSNIGSRVFIEKTNQTFSLKLSPFSVNSTRHLVYRYN